MAGWFGRAWERLENTREEREEWACFPKEKEKKRKDFRNEGGSPEVVYVWSPAGSSSSTSAPAAARGRKKEEKKLLCRIFTMPNGCVEKERRLVWPPLASLIIHFATSDTPPPTTIEWGERRNVRYGMHFFPSWAEASRTLLPPVELYPPGIAIKLIELTIKISLPAIFIRPQKKFSPENFSLFSPGKAGHVLVNVILLRGRTMEEREKIKERK